MNKRLLSLVAALLAVSSAHAQTYYGKTFMKPQVVGSCISENVVQWRPGSEACAKPTRLGMTLFTEQSTNKTAVGKYFGPHGKNIFSIGANTTAADIDGDYLVHDESKAGVSTLRATVALRPSRAVYGAQFALERDLDLPVKGLMVRVGVPLVNVEHKLGYDFSNAASVAIANTSGSQTATAEQFFTGNVKITNQGGDSAKSQQNPLTKNRFKKNESTAGFGDISLGIGKVLVDNGANRCVVMLDAILPTSDHAKADYLFEPLRGNAGHFGLRLGVDAQAEVWRKKDIAVLADAHAKATYFFESSENRVLGLKNLSSVSGGAFASSTYGHYALVGNSSAPANPLYPAANILAESLRVRPGAELTAGLQARVAYKQFTIGVGYDALFRDAESVWRKSNADLVPQIVPEAYEVGDAFSLIANDLISLKAANLSTDAARTPVQLVHNFAAEATFRPMLKACSSMTLALGASYQILADNSGVEQYGVWLAAGWAF